MLRKRQVPTRDFDQMRRSTCANCPCACGVKVFLKKGSIVDLFGDEDHPGNKGSFCPKGLLAYRHHVNPDRLAHPLLRRSRAQALERASWAEAIEFTARRLDEVCASIGKDACYVHGTTSSPFGHLLGGSMFARGYGTPHGPWRFLPPAFGSRGSVASMFGLPGSRMLMNPPRDWSNSRCIVVYACDPAVDDPMTMGPIVDARDRGTRLVVIDTRTTVSASKASHALRVRPGMQAVALRGILWLLFENRWVDENFVREATNGSEGLRAELSAFPAERVARLCGVPEAELRRVAEAIGTAAAVQVIAGGWLGAEELSDDDLRLCGALVTLRGSIGIPGGGLNLLNASPFDPADWSGCDGAPAESAPARSLAGVVSDRSRRMGAMFLQGDPCARLPGGRATLRSLADVPLIAVLAAYPNATTRYADVVFPLASWLESDGLIANGNGRALQWHHRVLSPPGECRTPLEFWTDLAAACGFAQRLPWFEGGADCRDRIAADWALKSNPWTRAITVDLLDPERNPPGGILWPCTEASEISFEASRFTRGDVRGRNILFQRHHAAPMSNARFSTEDGRVTFLAASRAPDALEQQQGALLLTASLTVDHVENYSGVLTDRPGTTAGVRFILHPRTAAEYQLKDGDRALVENATDALHGIVTVSDTAAINTIWCIVLPGIASKPGDEAVTSPWSLFPVPAEGVASSFYAMVKIRPDRGAGSDHGRQRG